MSDNADSIEMIDLQMRAYALMRRRPGLDYTTAFVYARRELRLANGGGEHGQCGTCGGFTRTTTDNGCTKCERKAMSSVESAANAEVAHGSRFKTMPHEDCTVWAIHEAHRQAVALGYSSVADIFEKAKSVTEERKRQILGGVSARCKAHEGLAVILLDPVIETADGREATYNDTILQHYIYGLNRKGGMPDVERLCTVANGIHGLKTDRNPRQKAGGTSGQSVYRYRLSRRFDHNTFVYNDGNRINAWHGEYKMKK